MSQRSFGSAEYAMRKKRMERVVHLARLISAAVALDSGTATEATCCPEAVF